MRGMGAWLLCLDFGYGKGSAWLHLRNSIIAYDCRLRGEHMGMIEGG